MDKGWKRYMKGLHNTGPFWVRYFGDDFSATVFEKRTVDGRFAWFVADRQNRLLPPAGQGLAPSLDEAKVAAESTVLDRKRGRRATVDGVISSTDRNRRRVDRLLASETQARALTRDLADYHQELVAAGEVATADRIAAYLRRAALAGLADYMRRTGSIRVRSGYEQTASPDELKANEDEVSSIADELEAAPDLDTFERITNKLRSMGAFPDSEFYSAVTQSYLLRREPPGAA